MARKVSQRNAQPNARGLSDVIGIVLIALALLLLVAQFSFDRRDVAHNTMPPNVTIHNWIGIVGAYVANGFFFLFGAGAYVLPVILLIFGLGYIFEFFSYLKRRWAWAVALFLCCVGLLDLYYDKTALDKLARNPNYAAGFMERTAYNLNAHSPGGLIGQEINELIFGHFGRLGATIVFATVYLVCLIFLTNFRLGDWLRGVWAERKFARPFEAGPEESEEWSPEEKVLARKARELEKKAEKLKEEVERSGLGADLKPVPIPTIRDLSIPTARAGKGTKKPEMEEPPPVLVGEVITAREIEAATTEEVLGKKPKPAEPVKVPAKENPFVPSQGEKAEPVVAAAEPKITDNTGAAPRKPLPRKKPISVAATPSIGNYQLPSFDFLQLPDPNVKPTESKEELMANARLMQSTLAQFDIEVSLGDITKGPTITRYELHPAPGVRLEKITALNNNIAAALKAERINILAPVPGKSSVGVEVPNLIKTKVIMRDLLESEEWAKTKARIPLALGKDVYGHPIIADLGEMPHLLIAGSTGSGKSVCINAIIASLLYRFPPDQLRFVMIDPKVVELQQYNTLPHLVVPVVNDPKKVILALRWVVNEMEKRYQIFAKVGVRNIKSFNERPRNKPLPPSEPELPLMAKKEKIEASSDGFAVELDEEIVVPREDDIVIPDKLSYIVVIIDELADLMLVAPADVEMAIARITQMARAAGIHCIVATQRPSVDVITGVIKANIPARIAFQVAAKVDSRTILDAMGADKLLGKGDMLYLPPGSAKLIRAQGALITDQEIQNLVDFIAKQGKPSYELEIHQQLQKPAGGYESDGSGLDEDEDLIQQCIEVIRSEQKASVSLMQRRLRLGYTRAARIMDELENRGIVGPSKGAEPRDILIDLDGGGADGGSQQAV
ncbi:MAG TPA: DNA translocase FtsK [Verrucomicrobiae bacterium]